MASNDAPQVNEGLYGDPPYLTMAGVKDDSEFGNTVQELSTLGCLMGESQSSVPELLDGWKVLRDFVHGLADTMTREVQQQPWDALNAETQGKLLEIAPTMAKRLWDDDNPNFQSSSILVEAWIWRIITSGLFCNPREYATPGWKAFGTLDANLSRRAGTLDGAIHPPELRTVNNREKYKLEHRYHQWRALTYGMLRTDEEVPHTSPDRLALAIVEAMTPAFMFDQDSELSKVLKEEAAKIAACAVEVDGSFLITVHNPMLAYRLPGGTEGELIGTPFNCKGGALEKWDAKVGDEGDPIELVVSPGIFTAGVERLFQPDGGHWVGSWLAPIQVCVGYHKLLSVEGESKVASSTRKRKHAKTQAKKKEAIARKFKEEREAKKRARGEKISGAKAVAEGKQK
ncbi:hypothetical protein B0T16DRAFT_396056 [Cercophora newfieldiana]|uniref:Uncharacterized protein n=1 Tax=Cercophora newfieldiana TaxID=92897 RepID=A0AA40CZK6_9PEZI|nr:hypothetical protein B0T16DRAFT_396056 [Cercophora newfieldiana]